MCKVVIMADVQSVLFYRGRSRALRWCRINSWNALRRIGRRDPHGSASWSTARRSPSARGSGPRNVAGIDPQPEIFYLEPARALRTSGQLLSIRRFDRHDFPWLFSPLKVTPGRPALDRAGRDSHAARVALNPSPPPALPVLTINPPASPAMASRSGRVVLLGARAGHRRCPRHNSTP
jgi:hypothetical protein